MDALFASLIWGSIGTGYFIYGKRQTSPAPMIGGLLIVATSYFAQSGFWMSAISVALIATIHLLLRWGY